MTTSARCAALGRPVPRCQGAARRGLRGFGAVAIQAILSATVRHNTVPEPTVGIVRVWGPKGSKMVATRTKTEPRSPAGRPVIPGGACSTSRGVRR